MSITGSAVEAIIFAPDEGGVKASCKNAGEQMLVSDRGLPCHELETGTTKDRRAGQRCMLNARELKRHPVGVVVGEGCQLRCRHVT
ncbi:hypothetical protein TNCV_1514481 [Trichonephila clavipes]|nr:hypothetical protein TNCV_1514481 [Trichonephila clavipes]